ncbi:MAG: hypothetical protein ACE5H3_08675 [Planctomycetota bacterium]
MTRSPQDQPSPPPSTGLARAPEPPVGSLLRLRDVQSLNRAFRRLAEVQDGLLEHLEKLEVERTRPSRRFAPLLYGGFLVLGIGLGLFSLAWWQKLQNGRPAPQPPVVQIPAPEVTIQAPEGAVTQAMMNRFLEELDAIRSQRQEDQQTIASLRQQLFEGQEATLQALRGVGAFATELAGKGDARDSSPASPPRPLEAVGRSTAAPAEAALPGQDEDPAPQPGFEDARQPGTWLGVTNGLLAMDGYNRLRFQSAERVSGKPELRNATVLEWGTDGLVAGALRAARVEFDLHRMTHTLVVRFRDGYRTRDGVRRPFAKEGVRMEFSGVNVDAWLEHFPELAANGENVALPGSSPTVRNQGSSDKPPAGGLEGVRQALDQLLSQRRTYGYYRLASLGGMQDGRFQLVQINWFDGSGRLLKTWEADSLEILLQPPGSVELLLQKGAILEGGVRHPFYQDRFRLILPRQDLDRWRQAGIPLTDRAAQ